jgi:UDP-N-acetylmuramyl pentapeptide synthase
MQIEELYQKFKTSKGVTTDTRNIGEGQLFFALKRFCLAGFGGRSGFLSD